MRKFATSLLGARVSIGLSRQALRIVRHGALGRNNAIVLDRVWNDEAAGQSPLQQCRAALAESSCSGLPLSITLGDDLVRLFMVTPPQNAARKQDLSAAAGMRFQSLYGEPPRDWLVDAAWQADKPFLACAVPRQFVEEYKTVAKDLRMPLTVLQPHFVAAWNAAHGSLAGNGEGCWLAVLHGRHLSLGIVPSAQQGLSAVRGIALPDASAGMDWLLEQVERAALQAGTDAAKSLLLAGDAHQAWTDAKDNRLKVIRFDKETMPGAGMRHALANVPAAAKAA